MLIKPSEIIADYKPIVKSDENKSNEKLNPDSLTELGSGSQFIDFDELMTKHIGILEQGKNIHYYSYANFNLVRLINHLLNHTGAAHCFMTSYSFSPKSINSIKNRLDSGKLLSFRVIIDNRVKSLSPKPFQMLSTMFDYKCTSIHAKVALIWNDNWKVSVVTSQNATDNPKMERGTIFTDSTIFNFDFNALTNAYNRGTK